MRCFKHGFGSSQTCPARAVGNDHICDTTERASRRLTTHEKEEIPLYHRSGDTLIPQPCAQPSFGQAGGLMIASWKIMEGCAKNWSVRAKGEPGRVSGVKRFYVALLAERYVQNLPSFRRGRGGLMAAPHRGVVQCARDGERQQCLVPRTDGFAPGSQTMIKKAGAEGWFSFLWLPCTDQMSLSGCSEPPDRIVQREPGSAPKKATLKCPQWLLLVRRPLRIESGSSPVLSLSGQ